ncbi:PQQ-dependent sugar dehydrogenase [Pedobacter alpinus]|uniref:PQQ-dependent sugar dehydrogenase n=1 Tax=Pedobacter alpinus TaxID=1590643 RepID=A0ABW5TVR1_9SPHI
MTRSLGYLFIVLVTFCIACSSQSENTSLPIIDNIALSKSLLKVEVLAKDLNVPWDLAYADDGYLWFTEQSGSISRAHLTTGQKTKVLTIKEVWSLRTTGLLGLAIHPDFKRNPYVFVNYTVKQDTTVYNKLVRYYFANDTLTQPKLLLTTVGYRAHNGSRLAISNNGKLLWATGDAYNGNNAQSLSSLNGKILRLNLDGSIPKDNPYPNSYVWARGFRNMQGLTVSDKGKVYTSEHGDAIEDEVNLIEKGGNYGWPFIEGMHNKPEELAFADAHQTKEPLKSWTPVIAPSGISYYNSSLIPEWKNSLLLTTLKAKSFRVLSLNDDGTQIKAEEVFFENHYGRLRDVCSDAEGNIYISTSNHDWNPQPGFPLSGDDKILKISPAKKPTHKPLTAVKVQKGNAAIDGAQLYNSYCASCHQTNGQGVKDVFPALAGSKNVTGSTTTLIKMVQNGINSKSGQQMPSFSFLKDQETAAILTYIRKSWNNKSSAITPQQVKSNR